MITKEEGRGITPLMYPANKYKSIAFIEPKEQPLFLVNKILSVREWLPLMGITIPITLIPENIVAPIKEELPVEDAIELIAGRTTDSIAQEIIREERYSLRNERKRPWSIKTRRPFRGKIDKVEIIFRESIELAEKVAYELGSQIKISNRGRPPVGRVPYQLKH
jgi:hypothetical protein